MIPAFTINLGQPINSGLAVIGRFDGKIPSLACATTGGKVLLHSPHEGTQYNDTQLPSVRLLNFNRKITSLAAGQLASRSRSDGGTMPDYLFTGTQSNVLAYDVERNSDVFFRDVQDGVNKIVVGRVASMNQPLVITGGNCSILGFDNEGNEVFWTVTSDNVSSLELCDIDNDGLNELLVGSEDFEVRIFKNEEIVSETAEADKVTILKHLGGNRFAYGLANGTVGVYSGAKTRLWRVKTKNKVSSVLAYDVNADGVNEVVSGWSNGTFNVRNGENGEVLYRSNVSAPVAALLRADYRMDGKEELMVCSEAGEVKGLLPADAECQALSIAASGVEKPKSEDDKVIGQLQATKQELKNELKMLEKNLKYSKTGEAAPGSLPPETYLSYELLPDIQASAVLLRVSLSSDAQIVNVLAIDLEGAVLEGSEVMTVAAPPQSRVAVLPLCPVKYQTADLLVQTHLLARAGGHQLHVMEKTVRLPKFSSFRMIDANTNVNVEPPASSVVVNVHQPIGRLSEWISSGFILTSPIQLNNDKLKVTLVSVCAHGSSPAGLALVIQAAMQPAPSRDAPAFLAVKFRCNSMDLAGELIQDLAKYFNLSDLESVADFQDELTVFEEVIRQVADYNSARVRLAADMADDSQRVKALVIRAEDSRLMNDMETMRRSYTELSGLNNQLISGYNVRAANHQGLLAALKDVNLMIQKAANLRVGKPKSTVVTDCRAAVKANNMAALFRIIRQGFD